MFFHKPICPKCQSVVLKDAKYCGECGQPLNKTGVTCGKCGQVNLMDAKFCGGCGSLMQQSAAVDVKRHHWSRNEMDFAARIEAQDLPGLLRKGLVVEPGTKAMLIINGESQGVLIPGQYSMDSVMQQLGNRFSNGIPHYGVALLVDEAPVDLDFQVGGELTRDDKPTGMAVKITLEVDNAEKCLTNLLRNRQQFTHQDLREKLYPEISAKLTDYIRSQTLHEISEDIRLRERFELHLEEYVRRTLALYGLRLVMLRTASVNQELDDELRRIRSKLGYQTDQVRIEGEGGLDLQKTKDDAKLKNKEHQKQTELIDKAIDQDAEIQSDQQDFDHLRRKVVLDKEISDLKYGIDQYEVEDSEKRVDLLKRMNEAVLSEKMNDVKTEKEFESFIDDLDFNKLLKDKERQDLMDIWLEEKEDKNTQRAYLAAKLESDRRFEIDKQAIFNQYNLEEDKLDSEIRLKRKSADFDLEMQRKFIKEKLELEEEQDRIKRERARLDQEIENQKHKQQREEDRDDAEFGVQMLERMKKGKRLDEEERLRMHREDDLIRKQKDHEIDMQKFENDLRLKSQDQTFELNRMEKLKELGPAALISVSGVEQARVIAKLQEMEAFKSMSADQILAAASKDSPEVAKAIQEKFKAEANSELMVEIRKQTEKQEQYLREMISKQDHSHADTLDRLERADERNAKRVQDMSQHSVDRITDVAKSFAQNSGQGTPIIITQPGAVGQSVNPGQVGSSSETQESVEKKQCLQCGHKVDEHLKFCQHCGFKFPA